MSHRHWCDWAGHDWECGGDCECCCGLPMEGHDHSGCPVELRACPEHAAEEQRRLQEAMSQEPDPALVEKWRERPHCECGCADTELSKVVGFCLWCDHTYAEYNSRIEDLHFGHDCPGAPEDLRQSARERLQSVRQADRRQASGG